MDGHGADGRGECDPETRTYDPRGSRDAAASVNDERPEKLLSGSARPAVLSSACGCTRSPGIAPTNCAGSAVGIASAAAVTQGGSGVSTGGPDTAGVGGVFGAASAEDSRKKCPSVVACTSAFSADSPVDRSGQAGPGESAMYSGTGQPSSSGSCSGSSGGSRIRRLLRGRTHSSHGSTTPSSSGAGAAAGSGSPNGPSAGSISFEERSSRGQHSNCCRERAGGAAMRSGRPSASKSTSSLLDASSPSTSAPSSAPCSCASTSNGSAWSAGNSFYAEAFSLGTLGQSTSPQLQLASSSCAGSSAQASSSSTSATTSHKTTKNKVGSWALKLCKRSSPGSSGSGGASSGTPGGSNSSGGIGSTFTAGPSGSGASSKSTNSSPSKGPMPLGHSGCHQGGFSASLPLAAPALSEAIHSRYHCHQCQPGQPDSANHSQAQSESVCSCCTPGPSREPGTSASSTVAGCGLCGAPAVLSSGTPNATRRRMATAIINQLSAASSPLNGTELSQANSGFGGVGGSDDLDERARIERAREIAEGVDPPPGFIRAHEVIPDEIAAALRSLNLDALPWDVLGKIWDLNPSPHTIPLCLAPASSSGHGHGSGSGPNSSGNSGCSGATVHTTVDYMHCLVPDLAQISRCGFYWGKMDRYEAERLLQKKPEGSFLLRDSAQEEYLFSVSFRRYGRSLHARIEQWNHNFSFDSHDPGVFSSPTVCGLIEHYKDPACCMYFEPMLTIPINKNFPFSLQHLARCAITERVNYDEVSQLHLPKPIKVYLREYHYKQRLRVRNVEKE